MQAEPESPPRDAPTTGLRAFQDVTRTAFQDASRLVSTLSHEVDWPWSGSVRRHVYTDFVVYIMLLVVFCCITLVPTTKRSSDSFNLVQSIQSTLVKEVSFHAAARCAARANEQQTCLLCSCHTFCTVLKRWQCPQAMHHPTNDISLFI